MNNKIIDKSNWKMTKFGNVVTQRKDSINLDDRSDGMKFIAGEHIDSENIHINKWGIMDESYLGPAFHRTFQKGDILYGSRRTYLKKVAIAHFDGITSNTTFVIKPNKDLIDERLVPFLMLSEKFTKHSIKNSKGSVNPYINWKDIADFEFLLPAFDQQQKIADLLWSGDIVLNKTKKLRIKFSELLDSELYKLFTENNSFVSLKDLLIGKPQYGASRKAIKYFTNMPRYIRITDIDASGNLNPKTLSSIDGKDWNNYLLKNDDILLARTADPGKSFLFNEKKHGFCVFAGYLIKFCFNKSKILPNFFFAYTKTSHYWTQIRKRMKKGTLSNINTGQFESILVPLPTIKKQEYILKVFSKYQNLLEILLNKYTNEEKILISLINEIFNDK